MLSLATPKVTCAALQGLKMGARFRETADMLGKRAIFPRITGVLPPAPLPHLHSDNSIPMAATSTGDRHRNGSSHTATAPSREKKEAGSSSPNAAHYWISTGRRLQELHTFIHERTRHLAEVRTRAYETLAGLQIEETKLEHALQAATVTERTSVETAGKQLASKSTLGKAASKRGNKR